MKRHFEVAACPEVIRLSADCRLKAGLCVRSDFGFGGNGIERYEIARYGRFHGAGS
jgi:hypothetical protein